MQWPMTHVSICLVFSEIYNTLSLQQFRWKTLFSMYPFSPTYLIINFVSLTTLLQEWCPCNTCHGPFNFLWKGNPFCMWPSDLLKVFVIRDLQRSLRFYQNIKWSSFCFQQIESPHIKAIKVCRHPLIRTTLSTYILMWWWQRAY